MLKLDGAWQEWKWICFTSDHFVLLLMLPSFKLKKQKYGDGDPSLAGIFWDNIFSDFTVMMSEWCDFNSHRPVWEIPASATSLPPQWPVLRDIPAMQSKTKCRRYTIQNWFLSDTDSNSWTGIGLYIMVLLKITIQYIYIYLFIYFCRRAMFQSSLVLPYTWQNDGSVFHTVRHTTAYWWSRMGTWYQWYPELWHW